MSSTCMGRMTQPGDSPNLPGWEAKADYESGPGDQAFTSWMKSPRPAGASERLES